MAEHFFDGAGDDLLPFLAVPEFRESVGLEVIGISADADAELVFANDSDLGKEPRLAVMAEVGLKDFRFHSPLIS